jgi:hypothetical protein
MRIQLLSIGLLLGTAACGDDSPAGGSNTGGSPAGGDNSGAGQVGGSGGDNNGGQAPGGAPQGGAGGTGDGGAQVGGAGGAPCEPITDDASAIGMNCADAVCPAGYTCQPHNGVVFQELCAILCEEDCECPADHTCEMFADKSGNWKECAGVLNK